VATYSVVLLGRFPGKDRVVASTLARDFARDDAWGAQVVGAAPIVLLDNLSFEQAAAVEGALADVEAAGSRIEVQEGVDPALSKLSWPTPPRIKGKLVSEYGAGAVGAAGASGMTIGAPGAITASLMLPCPYTGQKMKLTLTISITKADNQPMVAGVTANVSAAAPQPIPIPVPTGARSASDSAYKPIPTPVVTPRVASTAPVPRRMTPNAGNDQAVIVGLDDLDELKPMEQFPAPKPTASASQSRQPQAPQARPQAPARPTNPAIPLPDVPVLHNQPPAPVAPTQLSTNQPMPDDLMNAPMDLSAFEAGVTASGIMRAATAQVADEPADDGSLCSVSIGKSPNSKVHQVVAELCGISQAEASRLCQKPIVTLATNISSPDAHTIKQRLATVGVTAKITTKRP
jgi:ribosomal protein L7/L12